MTGVEMAQSMRWQLSHPRYKELTAYELLQAYEKRSNKWEAKREEGYREGLKEALRMLGRLGLHEAVHMCEQVECIRIRKQVKKETDCVRITGREKWQGL